MELGHAGALLILQLVFTVSLPGLEYTGQYSSQPPNDSRGGQLLDHLSLDLGSLSEEVDGPGQVLTFPGPPFLQRDNGNGNNADITMDKMF